MVAGVLSGAGYRVLQLGRRRTARKNVLAFDLRDAAAYVHIHEWFAQEKTAQLRVVVLCHGAAPSPGQAEDARTLVQVQDVFEVDVLGTYRLCQAAWPYLVRSGGGSIIIVSSLHAKATYPERTPYAIAKHGLSGLVQALALDWGKDNIRVNAILPWQCTGTRTARVAAQEGDDTIERYTQRSPLRRLVEPADIARTVLWLTQCTSITGTEIVVDCGVSASMWHRGWQKDMAG